MMDSMKWLLGSGVGIALGAMLASALGSAPRGNCFTCIERCAPFRVAACEPAWSHFQPMYCACDPFSRVDDSPTIGPAKGK